MIYLYSYSGEPWKAVQHTHGWWSRNTATNPNSLSGNDDCGQMSAWYLFTCVGFYPVCPGSDYYVIGAPQIKKATIELSTEKKVRDGE